MRRLIVFNHQALDGYFSSTNGDMTWAHKSDPEWNGFVQQNASSGGVLLFGRKTYELMASYWPTPIAQQQQPVVAEGINKVPKVVFSRTLSRAAWNNTAIVKGDLPAEVRKMKEQPGDDMVILGSGTIVAQLTQEGLVDEYQIVVSPAVLGSGKTMFDGVTRNVPMKLIRTRVFGNGNVLLCYEPAP